MCIWCIFGRRWILNKMKFSKKCHFLPEKCIFLRKMAFSPRAQLRSAPMSRNFFLGGNFTPIFEAKKVGTAGQKCPGHFDSSQFSPKSAIFGGFEKKVSKSDWNQRHIVYVTQIHYYTWFLTTFGPKNAITLAKNYNFPFFKNSHFWLF